jgi:hypothetical protein
MHPLVFFAIAEQERAQRARDNTLIWRNARATVVARRRDARWAAAIARGAARRPSASAQESPMGCATA